MDLRTDFPCILEDIVPFGSAAPKRLITDSTDESTLQLTNRHLVRLSWDKTEFAFVKRIALCVHCLRRVQEYLGNSVLSQIFLLAQKRYFLSHSSIGWVLVQLKGLDKESSEQFALTITKYSF